MLVYARAYRATRDILEDLSQQRQRQRRQLTGAATKPGGATVAGKDGPHPTEGCRFGVGPHEPIQTFLKDFFQRRTLNARASHVGSNVWSRVHTMVMLERRADPNDGADVEVHQWSSGRSGGVSRGGGDGGGNNGGSDGDGGDGGATATRTDGKDKAGTATAAAATGGREDGGRRRTSRTLFKLRISCGLYEPSAMALDVRHMQLPIRPSSAPAAGMMIDSVVLAGGRGG